MLDEIIDNQQFCDAVQEVLCVAMGNAAKSLSEMINEKVHLKVPGVEFVTREKAAEIIGQKAKTQVSGVHQLFRGAFSGEALLLFPEKQSLELIRAVLQTSHITLGDLTDLEQEAITEIGNVILNACLCSMADLFDQQMFGEIPGFIQGSLDRIFGMNEMDTTWYQSSQAPTDSLILLLNTEFSVETKKIQGYVTFLMDVESIVQFKTSIASYMED